METSRIPRLAACGTLALATHCAYLSSTETAEFAATTKAARSLATTLDWFSESVPPCYEVDQIVESALFDAGAKQQPSQHRCGEALGGPVPNPHVTRLYEFPDDKGRVIVELVGITEEVGAHVIRVVFQAREDGFKGTIEQACDMMHPSSQDGMRWK